MNLYKNKVGIKNYNDELRVAIASGDGKSVSGNNFWLERVEDRHIADLFINI